MDITKANDKINKSSQEIDNLSFDTAFNIHAFELMAYDSVQDTLHRVSLDALGHFGTNDVDKNANGKIYEGLEDYDGNWQIVEISTSGTVTSNRFATHKNNPDYHTYTSAWTDRTTLTFETYGEAF
jgi:hypothetical protein